MELELQFKKEDDEPLTTNYAFACTPETRKILMEINQTTNLDVPETFRKFAQSLIQKNKTAREAS